MSNLKAIRERRMKTPEATRGYSDARIAMDFVELIYTARVAANMTQEELGERSGMTQPAIARIEGGGTTPMVGTVARLAQALGAHVTLQWVNNDSDQQLIVA